MPRVSVMIPIHNPGAFLDEALDSVRRQTMRDFEALCLDDGCTDGSLRLLERVVAKDPRFRVIQPGRVGLIEAANRLVAESRSPYLARFDADDAMHPERLALQAELLDRHPDVDVASSLVRHFPRDHVREGNRAYEAWLNGLVTHEQISREMLVELTVPNPSAMLRREVFARVGGYRDNGHPEDYDFWLRAWERGVRFEKVRRVLHYWRDHGARVTRTHPRYSVEAFLRAKAEALLRGPLADGKPYVVWGAGMIGRRLTRLLVKAGRPPEALLDIDPQKIGGTRHGRPVIAVEDFAPKSAMVLAAVGSRGARVQIRQRLLEWGLEETRDFWMVA